MQTKTYRIAAIADGDVLPRLAYHAHVRITPAAVNIPQVCLVCVGGCFEFDAGVIHPVVHSIHYFGSVQTT